MMEIENTTTQQGVSVHDRLVNYLKGDESPPEKQVQPTVEDAASTDVVDDSATVEPDTEERDVEVASEQVEEVEDEPKWMPQTFDELAEALEVEPDELRKFMKVRTKVDGESGEATLEEIQKNFQLEQHLNRRSQQFANERKEWEERQAKLQEDYHKRLQDLDDTNTAYEQMVASEYQNVNWKELQEEDPTQFLIAQQNLQARFMQLQQMKQDLAEKRKKEAEEHQAKLDEFVKQKSLKEREMTLDRIPEWQDDKVRVDEVKKLQEYLKNDLGMSDQELASTNDHRLFVVGRKAMLYDQLQTKVEPKKQQLKDKPKFVPPGARKSASDAKAKKVAELRKRSKQGDKFATRELLKMKMFRS